MLLVESNCFLLDHKNVISENKSKGQMVLRGTFQRANEANANSRIYRKPILEREVQKLMPLIKENRLLGELDHPENEVVRLQNASHMVTDLKWDGNDVIGECVLLNTPAGLTAQTLVRDGVKIGISSRGLGTLTDIGESVKEVNDDFDMRTFDLVADPSTRGAFPGLRENKNYIAEGRALVESVKKKALSERAFVVGIRKALGAKFEDPSLMINEMFGSRGLDRHIARQKTRDAGKSTKKNKTDGGPRKSKVNLPPSRTERVRGQRGPDGEEEDDFRILPPKKIKESSPEWRGKLAARGLQARGEDLDTQSPKSSRQLTKVSKRAGSGFKSGIRNWARVRGDGTDPKKRKKALTKLATDDEKRKDPGGNVGATKTQTAFHRELNKKSAQNSWKEANPFLATVTERFIEEAIDKDLRAERLARREKLKKAPDPLPDKPMPHEIAADRERWEKKNARAAARKRYS